MSCGVDTGVVVLKVNDQISVLLRRSFSEGFLDSRFVEARCCEGYRIAL